MITTLMLPIIFTLTAHAQEMVGNEPTGRFRGQPCTSTEAWTFTAEISAEQKAIFLGSLNSTVPAVEAFADARRCGLAPILMPRAP